MRFLLTRSDFVEPESVLTHPAFGMRSSVATLAAGADASLMELLRGARSIGGQMEEEGYAFTPSPAHQTPGYDERGAACSYMNGGYSTRAHSSYHGGAIDGVQIEHVWEGVRDTAEHREAYGFALAETLLTFLEEQAGNDPYRFGALGADLGGAADTCAVEPPAAVEARLFDDSGATDIADLSTLGTLSFDGEDDVLVITDRPLGDGDAFTVAFSFRADAADRGGYQYIWSHGTYSWRQSVTIFLSPWGYVGTSVRGAGERYTYYGLNDYDDLMDGEWHDYVLAVDTTIPLARVYLDGELVAEDERGAGGLDPNSPIHVGGREDLDAQRFFPGDISGIQILAGALSAEEVAGLIGE